MQAVIAGKERETLLQEIKNAFLQWPELERRVFSQAHYLGQSPEAISRSLQLDVEEVSTILKRCEHRLYESLRNFRQTGREESSLPSRRAAEYLECGKLGKLPHSKLKPVEMYLAVE